MTTSGGPPTPPSADAPTQDAWGEVFSGGWPQDVSEAAALAAVETELFGRSKQPLTVDRYRISHKIGTGASGVVYEATDPKLGRKVAIKMLHPRRRDHAARDQRFVREGRAMARLAHPNVVPVFDVGIDDGNRFIVMDLVEGETLAGWCRAPGRGLPDILSAFIAAGRGLEAAHDLGMVHRDFKPGNVLVDDEGRVRVGDFGLARAFDEDASEEPGGPEATDRDGGLGSVTETGALLGTPRYMAPEQHAGEPASFAADQFAFCAALFEVVAGQPPFVGATMSDLAAAKARGLIVWPTDHRIADALRRVLERGLAIDSTDRWPSMTELLDALTKLRSTRRRRGLWVIAGAAAVFAIVGLVSWRGRVPCSAADKIEPLRDLARHRMAHDAFVALSASFAEDSWERAAAALHDYGARWEGAYERACRTTDATGITFDRTMACLERGRAQADVLLDIWTQADATVARRAVQAARGLPDPSACEQAARAPSDVVPPTNEQRGAVQALRASLAGALALQDSGRIDTGLATAERVRIEAADVGYEPLQAEAEATVGGLLMDAGRPRKALTALERAYFLARSSGHGTIMLKSGSLLVHVTGYALLDLEAADRWARHAQSNLDRFDAFGTQEEASLHNGLGTLAERRGAYGEAVQHYERTLEIERVLLGESAPQLVSSMSNLGSALLSSGKLEEAGEVLQQAVTLGEAELSPDHPDLGLPLLHLGIVCELEGDLDSARERYGQARGLYERSEADDHPDLALARLDLGNVDYHLGNHEDAEAHYRAALAIQVRAHGPDHPTTARTLNNLANVRKDAGDHAGAASLYRRALHIYEDNSGPDDVGMVLGNIGELRLAMGQPERAREVLVRAAAILEAADDADDRLLANALTGLGHALVDLGRPREALDPLARSLTMREQIGQPRWQWVWTGFILARAHRAMGDQATARRTAQAALADGADGPDMDELSAEIRSWLTDPRAR